MLARVACGVTVVVKLVADWVVEVEERTDSIVVELELM